MTIPAGETSVSRGVGNDVATNFPFSFKVDDASELKVTSVSPSGAAVVLTYPTDYTVSGVGQNSGTVNLTSPLTDEYDLIIEDNVELSQTEPFGNRGAFFASIHERAFDKLTRLIKRINGDNMRAVRAPITDDPVDMTLEPLSVRAGKPIVFGMDGRLLSTETLPDSIAFNRNTIGTELYPESQAELNANVSVVRPYEYYGNIMRYGADPTFTTDSSAAIQAAIDQASWAAASDSPGSVVTAPSGTFMINNELHVYDDGVNNYLASNAGRIIIRGEGCGSVSDLQSGAVTGGTVFVFTSGSADGLVVGDGVVQTRAFRLHDISLRGLTTGATLHFRKVSQGWVVSNVTVANMSTSTPTAILFDDVFGGKFDQVYTVGPKWASAGSVETDGTGYRFTGGGGGNVTYINFNVKGFFTGVMIGDEFSDDPQTSIRTHNFINSQSQYNARNWHLRHGADDVNIDSGWSEGASNGGASDPIDFLITDSAGWSDTDVSPDGPGRPFGITVVGGVHNSTSPKFQIGDDTGTIGRDRHGPVNLINIHAPFSNGAIFRCHNTKGNGPVIIDNPQLGANSYNDGVIVIDADEAQFGPIILRNFTSVWRIPDERICKTAGGTDVGRKWLSQEVLPRAGTIGAATQTIDYANQGVLPERLDTLTGSGNTLTINLPSNVLSRAIGQTMLVCKRSGASGSITFQANGPRAWTVGMSVGPRDRVRSADRIYYLKRGDGITTSGNAPTGTGQTVDGDLVWDLDVDQANDTINGAASVTITGTFITALLCQNTSSQWTVSVIPAPS